MRVFGGYQNFNWEEPNLTPALLSFGTLIRYDWHPPFDQYMDGWHEQHKANMNRALLGHVIKAHETEPLDVCFLYTSGRLIFRAYVWALTKGGIPTINMSLDDKTHRYGVLEPTGWSGMVDNASAFTLNMTNDPTAVAWYESIGARAIYSPAGANPDVYKPVDVKRDVPVLFIGKKYGRREQVIARLMDKGIDVRAYGAGWPNGTVSTEDMVSLINRSVVTLGIAETGDASILSLKGRDFEVPMNGACYLTQAHNELAEHYRVGEEIAFWQDEDELADKCRYYLAHPEEGEDMRHRAAIRARRDHTWRIRFERAFRAAGVYA